MFETLPGCGNIDVVVRRILAAITAIDREFGDVGGSRNILPKLADSDQNKAPNN